MPVVSVRIPQLGEGLQEARLIEFLKNPGDKIKRDDPIYVMETDKATTEVESPYDGTLEQWLVEPDTVLPIGHEIAKMQVADGVKEMPADHHPSGSAPPPTPSRTASAPVKRQATPTPTAQPVATAVAEPVAVATLPELRPGRGPVRAANGIPIPPRTKRYLKENNLIEYAGYISAAGTKLMPDDVDAFIKNDGPKKAAEDLAAKAELAKRAPSTTTDSIEPQLITSDEFVESILPSDQQTLNYRMARGAQVALAATLVTDIDWTALASARDKVRDSGGPTGFAMLLWCVAQSMKEHPQLRSSVSTDGKKLRVYHHVNLGVAVSLPGDVLKIAVVRNSDELSRDDFFQQLSERIEEARAGKDQIDASTTVSVSNIGTANMRLGIPVVVTPACATIAIGEVRAEPIPDPKQGFKFRKTASLTMAFDHRVMNGVGAANFLNSIRELAANFKI